MLEDNILNIKACISTFCAGLNNNGLLPPEEWLLSATVKGQRKGLGEGQWDDALEYTIDITESLICMYGDLELFSTSVIGICFQRQ